MKTHTAQQHREQTQPHPPNAVTQANAITYTYTCIAYRVSSYANVAANVENSRPFNLIINQGAAGIAVGMVPPNGVILFNISIAGTKLCTMKTIITYLKWKLTPADIKSNSATAQLLVIPKSVAFTESVVRTELDYHVGDQKCLRDKHLHKYVKSPDFRLTTV